MILPVQYFWRGLYLRIFSDICMHEGRANSVHFSVVAIGCLYIQTAGSYVAGHSANSKFRYMNTRIGLF